MLTKLAEIDFRQPLQPIHVDARYSQLHALVRWGYLPLGVLSLECPWDSRTFSAERLRCQILHYFGWQLWEYAVAGILNDLDANSHRASADDRVWPPISVVVCTRDHPLSLERCLKALAQVDYPIYEVVVIDNCSRDAEKIQRIVEHRGFRCVREHRPGLDWARNRGIQESKNDIVAFLDDDALAGPGWLRGIAYGFEDPEVMAVTGLILPAEIETHAQHDFERYGGMGKGFVRHTIRREEINYRALLWASNWGAGANMAFRRTLFKAIGGFDVALDVGTPTCGGGDIEFLHRAVSAGHVLRYEPAAMVRHVHRRDYASLQQQVYNNGRGFVAYLLTIARNQPQHRRTILRHAIRNWLWEWLLRRLIRSVIKRDSRTRRFALTELWGSCTGLWGYHKSQQLAQQLAAERSATGNPV